MEHVIREARECADDISRKLAEIERELGMVVAQQESERPPAQDATAAAKLPG